MKQGWEIKKLGEVCDVLNGLWIGKKEPFVNICVIRNTNFTKDCKLNMENAAYIDAEVKQFATRKLKIGDIIVEKSGGSEKQPVGRVVLFNIESGDYSFSNFTSALRIKDNVELDCTFLHKCLYAHYLRGETFKLQSKTTGLHNLDMKGYLRLPIPVPPLPEQEKIVSELDCLSGIIEKKRQQLKELDALAQSIFCEMFGNPVENERRWEVRKIGDVCVDKKAIKRANKHFNKEDKIQYIDIASINNKVNIIEGTTPYVFEDAPSRAQQVVNYGDVLISLVRPNLKNIAIVQYTDSSLVASSGFCVLRTGENVDRMFLKQVVLNDSFTTYLMDRVAGANYPAVREEDIKQCQIGIPPLPLQQSFAQKIESIEKQKELIKQSIAEVETLFNSRMDFYFN